MSASGYGTGLDVEVMKSPNDKKLYRYMVMENGLRVLLISDPEMQPTAATEADGEAQPDAMQTETAAAGTGTTGGAAAAAAATGKRKAGGGGGGGWAKQGGQGAPASSGRRGSVSGEESSGDLQSEANEEEDDEEGEGEGSEEGDEGEDDEGEEEESSDEEEREGGGDGGGRGGRRRKGGSAGHKAPVKKAAAAMAVGVGSFSDPDDLQGLSHYLEHMLFMGSARYPAENDYDDYLTRHGGAANAFTELEVTNYHFEVAPAHLPGALDRFAQFFIAPLCNEGSMEREVLAIDSEFCQVLQDDHCRLAQIMCHTARPGHIYRKFTWGNKESLWDQPRLAGLDVRRRLLEYYKQHYGADRSCLVVLGGEDLDSLARLVVGAFADMPGGRGPARSLAGMEPPFKGRSLYVMPAVRDSHELRITFQLPPLQRLYGSKADSYISHLLGHEGPGSLLSALKARGWAAEILAGVDDDGYSSNSGCSLFGVDVILTERGLREGPGGCGLAVAGLVFAYINMMRREGPQEWVWQEMRAVSEQRWRFLEEADPLDTVSRLAGAMHVTSPQHILAADYLHASWQPELVGELLGRMVAAAPAGQGADGQEAPSYRIDLLTRQYDEVKSSVLSLACSEGMAVRVEVEPWFGLEVVAMELPETLCQGWAQQPPLEELRLPPQNPYLPTDFSLRCDDPPSDSDPSPPSSSAPALPPGLTGVLATPPLLLLDKPGLRLWHKLDRTFRTPRAAVHWRLFSPAGHTGARAAACSHLALKLVEEALREDAYLADVAGLHYHTSPEGLAGMEFRVDGFSDKLGVLVRRLAGALADLASERSSGGWLGVHYGTVREALVRKYRNMNMEVGQHASYSRLFVLCSRALHCDDILGQLEALTPEDLPPFMTALLARCHVEVLVHGNVSAAGARQLADAVVQALGPGCCLAADERQRDQCVVLPAAAAEAGTAEGAGSAAAADDGTRVRLLAKNPNEENAAVEVYFQLGPATEARDRAVLDLIDQVLYEPCYDTLRTKQQLGYSVYSGARLTNGISGFCIHVVSARHPPEVLDARVDAFLAAMAPRLRDMAPEELATHVAALTAAKMQRDRSLVDEAGRLWGHISSQRYDFLSRELEVAALESITAAEVYDAFVRYLLPPSAAATEGGGGLASQRRKLSVQIRPRRLLAAEKKEAAKGTAEAGAEAEPEGAADGAGVDGVDVPGAPTPAGAEGASWPWEPADLVSLRARLAMHPLLLGTAPEPLLRE